MYYVGYDLVTVLVMNALVSTLFHCATETNLTSPSQP